MADLKLCRDVAKVWVDGGGDAEGIEWCWVRIRDAVAEEIESREERARRLEEPRDAD